MAAMSLCLSPPLLLLLVIEKASRLDETERKREREREDELTVVGFVQTKVFKKASIKYRIRLSIEQVSL